MFAIRYLASTVALIGLLSTAYADDEMLPPKRTPQWRVFKVLEGNRIAATTIRYETRQQEVPYTVFVPVTTQKVVDGKTVNVTTNVAEQRVRTVTRKVAVPVMARVENVKLYRISGKAVSDDERATMVGKSFPAMGLTEGELVDPYFKALLKPETFVLIAPRPLPPKPVPVPVP